MTFRFNLLAMLELQKNVEFPKSVKIEVIHSQQMGDWDCGIACINMVLSDEKRLQFTEELESIMLKEDLDSSIWSIDLAFILKHLQVEHAYYTKTIGIDPSYSDEAYYKTAVDVDRNRVLRKFEEALERGICIENRTLRLAELIHHISKEKPAIVLVNSLCLECLTHFTHKAHSKLARVFSPCPKVTFVGVCVATFDNFERARTSHGTDDDIILIG